MEAQQFLAEFGHIANAPGGVTRIRELVFSLASDGRLLANSEPVEPIHLDHVADFVMGQAPPGSECNTSGNGTIFVKTGEFGELYPVIREWTTKPLKFAKMGDVLICVVGATVGKLNLAIDCAIGRSVAAIRPRAGLNTKFLYFMLMPFTLRLRNDSRGSAQGVIGKAELAAVKLRVPSEEEQSRIVAKVDELMALCDTLERHQQARRELQNNLRLSTLQAVADASSPHDLQVGWTRLSSSFRQLFSSPKDVGALRSLVLELAVQGLLTEQTNADEPAELNIAEIRRRTRTRAATGRRKTSIAYRSADEEELGHPLPNGWTTVRLGELVRVLNGRAYSKAELLDKGTPVLRVGNLFTSKDWYYSNLELQADKYCDEGDLLYAWSASFGPFIWNGPRVIFHYHIWKLDLFSGEHLSKQFLYFVLQERTAAIKTSGHGISMAHMTKERMEQLPVAVPPLNEQHRIVARVCELLRFCDEIESHLREGEKAADRFAAAAVAALTGIAVEQEEEPMKAPQTELIAPLRLGNAPDIKAQAPLATILARHNGEVSAKDLWQRFGGEIEAFYAQLKTEVAHGWILEPAIAEMREKPADAVGA